jgi:hypothetical protein
MYRLINFGTILTAATLLCWPAPTLADHNVAYRDHVSGTSTVTGGTLQTGFTVVLNGTGEATHLGRSVGTGSQTLFILTGEISDGEFTYTAVDGSTLSGTFSGSSTTLDPMTGLRRNDLDLQFVEGTGRLAGLKGGTAQTTVFVMPVPGSSPPRFTFTYTSEGYLTFPDNRPQP